MDGPPENDFCSICHANFHIPCQANCSHWFCGNCILQVWNHGSALHPCKCPLCRREITLLVPGEASSRQRQDPEVAEVLQWIERYNRLYGERANGLMQRMRDLPFLLKRLWQDLINPQRSLPLVMRARVYLARFGGSSPRKRLFDPAFWFMKVASNDMPLKMIVSAIYVISPVDIIPEALLGIIGLLDDFIIVLICFLHVAALYRSVLVLRHGGS